MTTLTLSKSGISNAVSVVANYMASEGIFKERITLSVDGSTLSVKASDFVESMEIKVNFENQENVTFNAFSVNGKMLLTALKAVKKEELTFVITENQLLIKHGRSKITLDVFAETQTFADDEATLESITITKDFITALKNTEHSTDTVVAKHELHGVYLHAVENQFKITSTDTHRLTLQIEQDLSINGNYIVPKVGIKTLTKYCIEGEILSFGKNSIMINNEYVKYTCSLINGTYPHYQGIIPKSFAQTFNINRALIVSMLKDASLFEKAVVVKISGGQIILSDGEDKCEVVEEIETGTSDISFKINAKYALDFLTIVDSETVDICFNDTNLPLCFKVNENLFEIIMPIVIKEDKK